MICLLTPSDSAGSPVSVLNLDQRNRFGCFLVPYVRDRRSRLRVGDAEYQSRRLRFQDLPVPEGESPSRVATATRKQLQTQQFVPTSVQPTFQRGP